MTALSNGFESTACLEVEIRRPSIVTAPLSPAARGVAPPSEAFGSRLSGRYCKVLEAQLGEFVSAQALHCRSLKLSLGNSLGLPIDGSP